MTITQQIWMTFIMILLLVILMIILILDDINNTVIVKIYIYIYIYLLILISTTMMMLIMTIARNIFLEQNIRTFLVFRFVCIQSPETDLFTLMIFDVHAVVVMPFNAFPGQTDERFQVYNFNKKKRHEKRNRFFFRPFNKFTFSSYCFCLLISIVL